jgi:dGTPase
MAEPYDRFSESLLGRRPSAEHPSRSPVAKDRDRVVHCGAFRRLQRKSQIVGVQASDFFRRRLTHTVECAQIGRGIALRVKESDLDGVVEDGEHLPDLIEAACLAHDLGHPPFGHNGEVALTRLMNRHARGQFEANAQSFRIVTNLEPKVRAGDRWCGLDLTRTTLKAIMKYPITEDEAFERGETKFCVYHDDEDLTVAEWLFEGGEWRRTIATDILDVADDIAYAAHDFEDGVWSGKIPLFRLLDDADDSARRALAANVNQRKPELSAGTDPDQALHDLLATFGVYDQAWARVPFDRSRDARASLKNISAGFIGRFIDAVTLDDRFQEPPDEVAREIELLKGMASIWLIHDPAQETLRFGQRRLLEDLFDGYWRSPSMLPQREAWSEVERVGPTPDDRRYSDADVDTKPEELVVWRGKARLICDHVAGMTDLYALHVHGEMYHGGAPTSLRLPT